jgi:hypothetical protein
VTLAPQDRSGLRAGVREEHRPTPASADPSAPPPACPGLAALLSDSSTTLPRGLETGLEYRRCHIGYIIMRGHVFSCVGCIVWMDFGGGPARSLLLRQADRSGATSAQEPSGRTSIVRGVVRCASLTVGMLPLGDITLHSCILECELVRMAGLENGDGDATR